MHLARMRGFVKSGRFDGSFIWPALTRAGYGRSEDDLIRAIRENKSKQIVHYAVIGLMDLGGAKCLRVLKDLINYPSRDVRTTAVVAVGRIAQGQESDFYGSLLDDPVYKDKMYPMTVLWEVGTEVALPAVIRLAKKIITGKGSFSRGEIDPRYVKQFLERYKNPETEPLIEQLGLIVKDMTFEDQNI